MSLPPMYFPVYNLHFRLPEPGLHSQPLIGTPPMPHVEGLHLVQWIQSDQTKLTTTVMGDGLRLALKDYDTGKLIPHLPIPVMAGPFLLDTVMSSQYLVLFNQPDVKLDGQEVGIFFWGVAPTWRCHELKMPFPPVIGKKMKQLGQAGAARKVASEAKKRAKEIDSALDKIDQLSAAAEDALAQDELSPDAAAKSEKKEAAQQAKVDKAVKDQMKAADKQYAADQWAAGVDADDAAAKSAAPEDPTGKQVRQFSADMEAKLARSDEKQALKDKKAADKRARKAQREADKHDAKVVSNLSRDSGSAAAAGDAAVHHQEQADEKRAEVKQAQAESKAHADKAKQAAKAGSDARKSKSSEDRRRELAKEHHAKHGKSNPYKTATGIGNMTLAFPSLLCHVPFPCTVQIYMSWMALLKNWFEAAIGMLANVLNSYLGFVFDSLGAGRGVLATWAATMAKALTTSAVNSAKTYLTDGKVNFKVSTKTGVVTTSAELNKDSQTGEWKWKASADAGKGNQAGELKGQASAEGKLESAHEPDAILPDAKVEGWSASGSAKVSDKKLSPNINYSRSEKTVPEKTGSSGEVTPAKEISSESYGASISKAKVSRTTERTSSADGSGSTVVTDAVEGPGAKASRSTATTRAADGTETVTQTEAVSAPGYKHIDTKNAGPTQSPAAVDYAGGAPLLGAP